MKKNNIRFIQNALIIAAMTMISCSDEDSKWGKPLEAAITISDIEIHKTDYDVDGNTICMLANTELQLSYTLTPENVTNKNVIWSTSDETIVTVTDNGKLTSTGRCGEALIRLAPEVGNNTIPSRTIVVVDHYEYIQTVTVNNIPTEEIDAGNEYQLLVTAIPENATFKRYRYESSNPEIAVVDENGVIKGISKGEATITVTAYDLNPAEPATANFKVNIRETVQIEGLDFINDPELSQLGYEQDYQIKYKLEPEDATNSLLSWESDNKEVISVDQTGKLHVHSMTNGSANITASYGLISKSVTVSVAEGRFCYSFANGLPTPWSFDNNQSSKSVATSDGKKTTVLMENKSGKYRGDLNLLSTSDKKILTVTPGEYRYLVLKIRTTTQLTPLIKKQGEILFEIYDQENTLGGYFERYNGSKYLGDNAFEILDVTGDTDTSMTSTTSPNILYYDMKEGGKYSSKHPDDFDKSFNITSFKLKMPNFVDQDYDIYWIRTFKTIDDIKAYVNSENNN